MNSCLICGKQLALRFSANDYITGDPFKVYQCTDCKTAVTVPLLTPDQFQKYYKKNYFGKRKSVLEAIINKFRARNINGLVSGKASRSMLEIGCGNGFLLQLLKNQGWKITGTELAPEDYTTAEVRPYVVHRPIKQCDFPDSSFDVVSMWQFLEHTDEPFEYLKTAHRLLKTGGKVLVEVPNFASFQAALAKEKWFHLEVPRHIFHFSPKGLTLLLEKAGFTNVRVSYTNIILVTAGFYQSFLNILNKRMNFVFEIANGRIAAKDLANNKQDLAIAIIATIPLLVISGVLFLAEMLFHKSGIIRVSATKPA